MIYLDNNATTMVPREVLRAMEPYYLEFYGNPHSAHSLGRKAHDGLEEARSKVASLLNAVAANVRFTSCGTESNAIVLRGFRPAGRRRIVASSVEHPSVLSMLRVLHERGEIELVVIDVDQRGRVDEQRMIDAIDANTALVCLMLAQNEVGTIQPVRSIADAAHRHGAFVLVDAVQAAGKIPLDVDALGADFLSISGHKLHAPKGIGALYIRKGLSVAPLWAGGGQEFGLRSGTEPVAAAVALGEASRRAVEHLPHVDETRALRDRFESALLNEGIVANGDLSQRLPNTANVSFVGAYGADVVRELDVRGVCASAGAACDSTKREASGVMKAMNIPLERALGAVRFSLSRYTTADEIDRAVTAVRESLAALLTEKTA